MKKNKKNKFKFLTNNERGVVSAYLLIATAVAVTLITGLVVFVVNNHQQSVKEVSRQKAIQIAESGIYYYKWYLAHSLDGKNVEQIKDFWQNGSPLGVGTPYEGDVADFNGDIKGSYEVEVDPPDPHSTIVIARSTGWTTEEPSITQTVQVRFRRPSWSEYSVLANDVMRFGAGTSVFGPIHSNNGIRFDGVANNEVTSSVEEYYDPDTNSTKPGVWTAQSNEDSVFLAGKNFPVPEVDFDSVTTDLGYMRDEAQTSGLYFSGDTYEKTICWFWFCNTQEVPVEGYHLTLRTDDKVEIRRVTESGSNSYRIIDETNEEVFDIPSNGLIYVDNHVWVDGQIDSSKLTIVSAKLGSAIDTNIYINNDVLYTNKDGSDTIGLIAENNISIGYYSEDDLEIDAALLAQKGRVGRDNYSSFGGTYNLRDEITVYGSMATNERYGFSWVSSFSGNRISGYDIRNLYFDNNLLYYPPPYFPTGSVYELDLWEDL